MSRKTDDTAKGLETVEHHEYGCPRGSFPGLHCICPGGPTISTRQAKPVTRAEFDAMAKRVEYLEAKLFRALRGRGGGAP